MEENQREMTYGEQYVGTTFNPSGDERVNKIKKLHAEAIDLLHEIREELRTQEVTSSNEALRHSLKIDHIKDAISLQLQAQMMAVKAITK